MTVEKFLNNINPYDLKTLIKHSTPKNEINGLESSGINKWSFGVVMDLVSKDLITASFRLLEHEFDLEYKQITELDHRDFVYFASFVRKQFTNVGLLMETLNSEEESQLSASDTKELDKYGTAGIYYSIDKNPLVWDNLSKLSFIVIFTRLSLDNTVNKIQQKKHRNELERINRQNRR